MNLGKKISIDVQISLSFDDTCTPRKVRKLIQSFHTSNFLDKSLSRKDRYGKVLVKVLKVLTFGGHNDTYRGLAIHFL